MAASDPVFPNASVALVVAIALVKWGNGRVRGGALIVEMTLRGMSNQ